MALTIACPGCLKRFTVDAMAGRKARCKDCGQVFAVPAMAGRIVPPASVPPREPTQPSRSGASVGTPATSTRPPGPPPRTVSEPAPDYLEEIFEEPGEAVYAGGLPPARVSYRRRSNDKALRMTLTLLGLMSGLGVGLLGVHWAVTTVSSRIATASPGIAANPNAPPGAAGVDGAGWPLLAEPSPELYAAGTIPKPRRPLGSVRGDVVKQVSDNVLAGMGLIDQMATALDRIHDPASSQAALAQLQDLTNQLAGLQARTNALPRPTPAEDYEIGNRVKGRTRSVLDRLRAVVNRLSTKPGNPVAALRMLNDLERISVSFEELLKRGGVEVATKPYVEVYIANVPDDDTAELLAEKLVSGAPEATGQSSTYRSDHKAAVLRIWPVTDPRGFAASIPFGRATVTGHKIIVLNPTVLPAEVTAWRVGKRREEEERKAEAAAGEKDRTEGSAVENSTPPT